MGVFSPEGAASTIEADLREVSPNMDETPPEFEGRRDNLAEKREKPCLIHQFAGGDLFDVGHVGLGAGERFGRRLSRLYVEIGVVTGGTLSILGLYSSL